MKMTIFELKTLFCRIDPMGLMTFMDDYCRLDEYALEAGIVFGLITEDMTHEDIVDLIHNVSSEATTEGSTIDHGDFI
jgi:hypothetical protein